MEKINWQVLMDYLLSAINAVKDFAAKEIPDIIQQLLTYEMINQLSWAFLLLAGSVLLFIVCLWLFKKLPNRTDLKDSDVGIIFLLVLLVPTMFTLFGLSFGKFVTSAQIAFTPKAYLIHYVKDQMMNKGNETPKKVE